LDCGFNAIKFAVAVEKNLPAFLEFRLLSVFLKRENTLANQGVVDKEAMECVEILTGDERLIAHEHEYRLAIRILILEYRLPNGVRGPKMVFLNRDPYLRKTFVEGFLEQIGESIRNHNRDPRLVPIDAGHAQTRVNDMMRDRHSFDFFKKLRKSRRQSWQICRDKICRG